MFTVVSPSSASVGKLERVELGEEVHEVARRRVAEVRIRRVRGLPCGADDDANRALGADGERALRRLAVDEHAARRRDRLRGERLVRRVRAVVRHLFADDEQQRDRERRRRADARRRRSSRRRCPSRRTSRGRGCVPPSTRGGMNGGTVSRCVESVTSGASTTVANRSSRPA